MTTLDLITSHRKGEALLNFRNDTFERVMVVFHANALNHISRSLHFGLKPGHLFVYVKRRHEPRGRWLLKDAGYLNYFRRDKTDIQLTTYNTLDKQKLLSKGWLTVTRHAQAVDMTSFSVLPVHQRTVRFAYSDTQATLHVEDRYLGNRRIYWNFYDRLEAPRAWFHQVRRLNL